jgi:hypothetical protein
MNRKPGPSHGLCAARLPSNVTSASSKRSSLKTRSRRRREPPGGPVSETCGQCGAAAVDLCRVVDSLTRPGMLRVDLEEQIRACRLDLRYLGVRSPGGGYGCPTDRTGHDHAYRLRPSAATSMFAIGGCLPQTPAILGTETVHMPVTNHISDGPMIATSDNDASEQL